MSQFNSFSYDLIEFYQSTLIHKINIFTELLIDNFCFLISFFLVAFRIRLRELRSGFKSFRNKVSVLYFVPDFLFGSGAGRALVKNLLVLIDL